MKNVKPIFLLIIFMFFFTACGSPSTSELTNQTQSPATTYIQNKGSDTIVNLALAWAELYQKEHPEVRISVTGGGSGTGIASLINGTVDIANASRKIKDEEMQAAEAQGAKPVEFVVARDAIAVIVN